MRVLLAILALANLGFAAWAVLVDRPAEPPAARDISRLPRLALAGEVVVAHPSSGAAAAVSASSAPAGTAPAAASGTAAASAPGAGRCVTVGPFADLVAAGNAAASLQTRGFSARQRDEEGEEQVEYWVYLDGLTSDAQQAQVLQRLRRSGIADAHAMPASEEEGGRVSVGLFTERAGAERRARDVQRLGLSPQTAEQRHRLATYWVDVWLASQTQTVPTAGLLPADVQDTHLRTGSCPAADAAAATGAADAAASSAAAPSAASASGEAPASGEVPAVPTPPTEHR